MTPIMERLRSGIEHLQQENERLQDNYNTLLDDAVVTRQQIETLRTLLRELAEALKDIRSDPHGCVFCDSGKLRNPQKQHQPRCGFAKIDAALARAEEVLK